MLQFPCAKQSVGEWGKVGSGMDGGLAA